MQKKTRYGLTKKTNKNQKTKQIWDHQKKNIQKNIQIWVHQNFASLLSPRVKNSIFLDKSDFFPLTQNTKSTFTKLK